MHLPANMQQIDAILALAVLTAVNCHIAVCVPPRPNNIYYGVK